MGSYKDSLTGKDFKVYEAHETRIFMSANIDRKAIESCLKIRRMIPSKLIFLVSNLKFDLATQDHFDRDNSSVSARKNSNQALQHEILKLLNRKRDPLFLINPTS